MTQAKPKLTTFADYLAFDDGSDRRYELTYGDLIEVPPESNENVLISRALDRALSNLVGFRRVRTHQLAIEVMGQPKNRFPDLTVLQPEHEAVGSTVLSASGARVTSYTTRCRGIWANT